MLAVELVEQSSSNTTVGSLAWPDPPPCRVFIALWSMGAYTASDKCPAQKRVWPCKTKLLATYVPQLTTVGHVPGHTY